MALGISIREFAKRDGCSDKLVRNALKSGHLQALDDGTLDPGLVGSGWRRTNRRDADDESAPSAPVQISAGETAEDAADRIVLGEGRAPFTQVEAERVKENYLALLRQLEYDLKSGEVVPIDVHLAEVGKRYANVRTRLLALPAEVAPRAALLTNAAEIQDMIRAAVTRALEELTDNDQRTANPVRGGDT